MHAFVTQRPTSPLASLVGLYHDQLVLHVRGRLHSAADAEDVVQEMWLRADAGLRGSAVGNVRAFLYRIAGNLAIDHIRRRNVRQRVHGVPLDDREAMDVASPEPSAEQALIDSERQAGFDAVLAGLPDRCRQALMLSRIEGWTHAKIAAHLGVSPNTVANDIRAALRLCLAHAAQLDI